VPIADIHSVTSLACAMSVGEYCQAYYLGRAKNLRMPNYEPQTPARKRAMTGVRNPRPWIVINVTRISAAATQP